MRLTRNRSTETVKFGIGHYKPGYKDEESGHYAFKSGDQSLNDQVWKLNPIFQVYKGKAIDMAVFEFVDTWWKKENHVTTVKISLMKDDEEEVRFDVNLGSITVDTGSVLSKKEGREVIAYWEVVEMRQHSMFYTDVNSLEFEQRMSGTPDNIGKRFYPVTSAIINGDLLSSKWLTIMTDRSFGGSVQHGRTEILINRRLTQHDKGGIDEKLDEPGPGKNGYNVQATFQIKTTDTLDEAKAFARQKSVQMRRPIRLSLTKDHPQTLPRLKDYQEYNSRRKYLI